MKFACGISVFQKAIQIVEKAISIRSTMPLMENIYIKVIGNTVVLRGHNLEIGISYRISNIDNAEHGEVLIKSKTLSTIVSKLDGEQIEISVDHNKLVHIRSGSSVYNVHGIDTNEYPEFMEVVSDRPLSISNHDLKIGIRSTLFSVSVDETKQFLNGVFFKLEQDKFTMVSTDGFRLSLKEIKLEGHDSALFGAIVPQRSLSELGKILSVLDEDGEMKISFDENKIGFSTGNFSLVSRLIQNQYPDVKLVIPKVNENGFLVNRLELLNAADRAYIIASDSNSVTRVSFSDDTMTIRANSPTLGDFSEDIAVSRQKGTGDQRMALNIRLVVDAIRVLTMDSVILEFNGELSPCVITAFNDDSYTHIVMPIRTGE